MKIGYARISTPKQSLDNQIALLKAEECEYIYSDVVSGYNSSKPQFEKMMELLRANDTLLVTGIDRLGRSTKDLSLLLEEFHHRSIDLVILGYEIDTRTASGRMIFNFMAMIAENERMRNLERIRQGIEGARKRGKHIGRPKKLDDEKVNRMMQLHKDKSLCVKELCLMYNVSYQTFYNYLKKENK